MAQKVKRSFTNVLPGTPAIDDAWEIMIFLLPLLLHRYTKTDLVFSFTENQILVPRTNGAENFTRSNLSRILPVCVRSLRTGRYENHYEMSIFQPYQHTELFYLLFSADIPWETVL